MEIPFLPTNTSEIHLHVEQLLQNTYWTLAEDLRLPKRQETPHIPGRVTDRVLVLQAGVRSVPLRWESWFPVIGPPETSWPHVISNGESFPKDLHLNAKKQLHSTTSKLQCWTPHAKKGTQPYPLAERLPKIIIRSQTPHNTPPDTVLPTRKTRLMHQSTGTSLLHQEDYTTHWTNLSHWGQTPKTMGTTNLQPVKRRPQTQ